MKAFLLNGAVLIFTSFDAAKFQGRSKQLPVIIQCNIDNIPNNDGHTLIAGYLETKKVDVITREAFTEMARDHIIKNVPTDKQELERRVRENFEQSKARFERDFPVLAQELTLNLLTKKATTDTIYLRVSLALKSKSKVNALTMYNYKALSQQQFIYAAIESCIMSKMLR